MKTDPIEILLVEDNASDAELALHALKRSKIANRIQWLHDGAEALDFIFGTGQYQGRNVSSRPKVILLDLKMPKVDGIEVLRQLKADSRTRSIPVVVMTTSREERDIAASYDLGVNSYVVKPLDFKQFTEVVEKLQLYWLVLNQPPAP